MVAQLLRLRAALLVGALRGSRAHVIRTIASLVLVVGGVVVACAALLSLRSATTDTAFVVTVLGGSAVTLGFALTPLIAGAVDPLDPRRFALYALEPRPLAGALLLAGLVSIPVLALIALAVCLVLLWTAHGVPAALAVLGAVLSVATCVLLVRVSMALSSLFLRQRRSRELTGLFLVALLVIVVPAAVFLASLQWNGTVPPQLDQAAAIAAVTPVGAAAALAATTATDAALWPSLVVAVLTVAALGAAWVVLVARLLTTPERPPAVRERGGLGWFAVAPGTAGGAVAARSLLYWMRDRRYLVNIVVVPVAALLSMVPLLVAGVPLAYAVLLPAPIMALFFGWLPHNDLAYDSTAIWLHFASGVRGISDRAGRLVPIVVVAIPVLAVAIPVSISLSERWALLPAMVGVCTSLFLSGLGLSSIASVASPYAVVPPGESPFRQPQRTGAGGAVAQGLVLVGALVLSGPVLWWGWLAVWSDIGYAGWALWGGAGIGVVVLAIGLAVGSAVFEHRESALMEFAEQN